MLCGEEDEGDGQESHAASGLAMEDVLLLFWGAAEVVEVMTAEEMVRAVRAGKREAERFSSG